MSGTQHAIKTEAGYCFAYALGYLMDLRGVGRRDIAQLCGISRATVSNILHGKSRPTLECAATIADYFRVSLDAMCHDYFYRKVLSGEGITDMETLDYINNESADYE